MEFLDAIAQDGAALVEGADPAGPVGPAGDGTVRVSSRHVQPIASGDVAAALADVALGATVNGMVEIAGPERVGLDTMLRRHLIAIGDRRMVVGDAQTPYFGVVLNDQSLTPGADPRLGATHLDGWLEQR